MSENIFPGIVYLDTGIISHLAKNKQLWPKLADFLKQNDLALGVSEVYPKSCTDLTCVYCDSLDRLEAQPQGWRVQ